MCLMKAPVSVRARLPLDPNYRLSRWKFARKRRREGENWSARLQVFLLPMVPCASSTVTRVSRSPLQKTGKRSAWQPSGNILRGHSRRIALMFAGWIKAVLDCYVFRDAHSRELEVWQEMSIFKLCYEGVLSLWMDHCSPQFLISFHLSPDDSLLCSQK